jgi:hypothetical protein
MIFQLNQVDESSSSKLPVNEDHNIKPIIQTQEQEQKTVMLGGLV